MHACFVGFVRYKYFCRKRNFCHSLVSKNINENEIHNIHIASINFKVVYKIYSKLF